MLLLLHDPVLHVVVLLLLLLIIIIINLTTPRSIIHKTPTQVHLSRRERPRRAADGARAVGESGARVRRGAKEGTRSAVTLRLDAAHVPFEVAALEPCQARARPVLWAHTTTTVAFAASPPASAARYSNPTAAAAAAAADTKDAKDAKPASRPTATAATEGRDRGGRWQQPAVTAVGDNAACGSPSRSGAATPAAEASTATSPSGTRARSRTCPTSSGARAAARDTPPSTKTSPRGTVSTRNCRFFFVPFCVGMPR